MLKRGGVGSGLLLAWLSQPAPERYQCTTDHDAAGAGAEATAKNNDGKNAWDMVRKTTTSKAPSLTGDPLFHDYIDINDLELWLSARGAG